MAQIFQVPAAFSCQDPLAEFYQHSTEVTTVAYCEQRSEVIGKSCSLVKNPLALPFRRVGEALHPGPLLSSMTCTSLPSTDQSNWVRLGTTNPSGMRQKEVLAVEQGCGVWGYAETQLSATTRKTSSQILKNLAMQINRNLRVYTGADVKTRHNSSWAGSWSGVMTTSDFPSQVVHLPWPPDVYNSGRVLTTRHVINQVPLLHTTIYGFPRGPTWPKALELTQKMLSTITVEIVLGSRGPRVVVGDYNVSPSELSEFRVWERHGWRSLQDFMADFYGWEVQPTSKHSCQRDLIWLSPEALLMVRAIHLHDVFAEHASLSVDLEFPLGPITLRTWPKPRQIPWDQVKDPWAPSFADRPRGDHDATTRYAGIFADFESSLDGHLQREGPSSLTKLERGRAQQLGPMVAPQSATCPKPSRPGEVVMRNNLLGMEVLRWFRQLRRLESMKHLLAAGKCTPAAETYRLELWSTILRAPGFAGGFPHWWHLNRNCGVEGAPDTLPRTIPTHELSVIIFDTFKLCYEKFESWHLRTRGKQLQAKYEDSKKSLFNDLKGAHKEGPDLLHYMREYEILAIDNDSSQVHLSASIDERGTSMWSVDNQPVQVLKIDDQVCEISPKEHLHPDAVLCQKQFLATVDEVHHELVMHWTQKWNAINPPTSEEWTRITGFFAAFIPSLHFDIEDITIPTWRKALKRYSSRAARGVDGISPRDLLKLPDELTQALLNLLMDIELGNAVWPVQLLHGIVICLAKVTGAHEAGQFRPVVIFGVVYRTWASIRSRQLLMRLHAHVPGSCYGFLPNSECSQVWLQLQASIEIAMMENSPWCGVNTDLRKAFNTIPRDHSQQLALQLGVPSRILAPWRSFMDGCKRVFQVGQYLSEELTSTVGVPEGCAMSVYMMVQLSMSMHVYLKHFAPKIWTTSYVDNIGLAGSSVQDLAGAWVCLQEFFTLWRMEPDLGKSYAWATSSSLRAKLSAFQVEIVHHASELGGALSFSRKHVQEHLHLRLNSLEQLWARLKASRAPIRQKLFALSSVLWPKALHGNDAHLLPPSKFGPLRTRALQALKLNKAGVNPILRLTFSGNMEHDPEFFHIRRTIRSFRRLCGKEPLLCQQWKHFMLLFEGKLLDGPFSKMVSLFSQLGWSLHPPFFADHDGLEHHFQTIDDDLLDLLLEEGWCQHVVHRCNRTSMNGLQGIDPPLVKWVSLNLTALDTALVASLQSGAFIAGAQHAKFDVTKVATCPHCHNKDTHVHWLTCPGYAELHENLVDPTAWTRLPMATRSQLIPTRNMPALELKRYLHDLPENFEWLSSPTGSEQHVFCDGSSVRHPNPWLCRAAWACVNAANGLLFAAGHVPGLCQSSDIAELHGLLACLRWAVDFMIKVHIWSDSKYIIDAVKWLWAHRFVPAKWKHQKLWQDVLFLLDQLDLSCPTFHWVPSHMDPDSSHDPFDDWWIAWNCRADKAAGMLNDQRGSDYWRLWHAADAFHMEQREALRQLRSFYMKVANRQMEAGASSSTTLPEMPEPERRTDIDFISEMLCIGWQQQCVQLVHEKGIFPAPFYVELLKWVLVHEDTQLAPYPISFLELTFGLLECTFDFPFMVNGTWKMEATRDRFERPTLAYCVGVVRKAWRFLIREFDLVGLLSSNISLGQMRVQMPCDGIIVSLKQSLLSRCHERLMDFTKSRPPVL